MGGVSSGLFRVFYSIRLPFCLILALLASFGLLFISSTSVESKMCILLICICVLCESILYFFFFITLSRELITDWCADIFWLFRFLLFIWFVMRFLRPFDFFVFLKFSHCFWKWRLLMSTLWTGWSSPRLTYLATHVNILSKLFDLSSALYGGIFRLRDLLLSVSLDDNLTTILCLVISRSGGVQFLCCPCSCMCSFLFIRLEGFCQPARVGGSLADGSGPLGSPIPASGWTL